jgi:hypothetical protein
MSVADELQIDKEKIKKAFDVSHFDINAVLRGAQLTLVGGMPKSRQGQELTIDSSHST